MDRRYQYGSLLAASLTEKKGFNADDQMHRYLEWLHKGYMNCKGPFPPTDSGGTVRAALARYGTTTFSPFCGSTDPNKAGNGSLMRLAPIPLYFAKNPAEAIQKSALSSLTTHGSPSCVDACRYFGGLIVGAIQGITKAELLKPLYSPVPNLWQTDPLCDEIYCIACGEYKSKDAAKITGEGHVVRTLEAALWCFDKTDNFKDGVLAAVNIGLDTDTTAAVFGQIAGAYYGESAIPSDWLAKLYKKDLLIGLAEALIPQD